MRNSCSLKINFNDNLKRFHPLILSCFSSTLKIEINKPILLCSNIIMSLRWQRYWISKHWPCWTISSLKDNRMSSTFISSRDLQYYFHSCLWIASLVKLGYFIHVFAPKKKNRENENCKFFYSKVIQYQCQFRANYEPICRVSRTWNIFCFNLLTEIYRLRFVGFHIPLASC